jgi:3'(2'), 5'-bisphosphate nucleotidase
MSHEFLEVARDLAVQAGRRIMDLRKTALVKKRKADHSLVTNADHDADKIIRDGLHKHFPKHSILTEESGLQGSPTTEYVWVVDPLDGTRAYAKGTAGFSVMIGLLRMGKPFAGVVVDPYEGHIYEAMKTQGTFHTFNDQRVQVKVSQRRNWNQMPIVTSTDFPERFKNALMGHMFCPWVEPINSVGIKVGLVVRQVADLYVNHHAVHYWDTVAPQVILEEAGGTMTFTNGFPLVYNLRGQYHHTAPTVCSNNQRHKEFLSIIQTIL